MKISAALFFASCHAANTTADAAADATADASAEIIETCDAEMYKDKEFIKEWTPLVDKFETFSFFKKVEELKEDKLSDEEEDISLAEASA